jgi:hypothetical protein
MLVRASLKFGLTLGNRAATFPLQMLGYDVDVVNTVQFSNHTGKSNRCILSDRTGYGFTDGHKTTPEQLQAVFNGLRVNGLVGHSRALTGYIPGAEALTVVAKQIKAMKAENSNLIYVLDRKPDSFPALITAVMGDIGTGLYVSEDVVPIYQAMLRLATVITPNQFEVEYAWLMFIAYCQIVIWNQDHIDADPAFGFGQATQRERACSRRILVHTPSSVDRPVLGSTAPAILVHPPAAEQSASVVQLCNRQLSRRRRACMLREFQDGPRHGDVGVCSPNRARVLLRGGRPLFGHGTRSFPSDTH